MATRKAIKNKKTAVKSVKKTSKKIDKEDQGVQDVEENDTDMEESIDVIPKGKAKKPVEVDAADILPEVEEKIEEDIVIPGFEDEDSDDVAGLDDEDLNPFGDKWEE